MEDLNRNFNLISLYLNDIQKYELLTKEEEYELLRKIREDKDEDARHLLILSNLRLVISVAKKSMGNGLLLIDLISEGNIGLIKAINKFDYEKGHRFSTYAVWWIKQSIKKAVINKGRDIRMPSYKYEQLSKVNRTIMEYISEFGETPTTKYIAEKTELKESKVVLLLNEFQDILSLNETIGDNIFLEDVIGASDNIEEKIKEYQTQLQEQNIDLNNYTMLDVIEDLEIVRKHQGYKKISVLSVSYGTRVALLYSYKYPEVINRTVMIGANPPGHFIWNPEKTESILTKYDSLYKNQNAVD